MNNTIIISYFGGTNNILADCTYNLLRLAVKNNLENKMVGIAAVLDNVSLIIIHNNEIKING